MTVDVFGRQLNRGGAGPPGKPGAGFKTTADGDYDLEGKRLVNVGSPIKDDDAVNLRSFIGGTNHNTVLLRDSTKQFFESNITALEKRVKVDLTNLRAEIDNLKSAIKDLNGDVRLLKDVKIGEKRKKPSNNYLQSMIKSVAGEK